MSNRTVYAAAELLWPNGGERTPETKGLATMGSWAGTDGVAFDADSNPWVTDPSIARQIATDTGAVAALDAPASELAPDIKTVEAAYLGRIPRTPNTLLQN